MRTIVPPLAALAAAREHEMAHPTMPPTPTLGVTHCESCGFSYATDRRTVTHRNLCATPHVHPEPDLSQ